MFGKTYKVYQTDSLIAGTGRLGQVDYSSGEIHLQNDTPSFKISQDDKEVTFLHELTHTIFTSIGEKTLSEDERIVDLVAQLLHQYHTTADYTGTKKTKK